MPAAAQAQRRFGHARGSVVFVGGYFYDPFYGPYPWWSPAMYPYPYYPVYDTRAQVRVLVKPNDAAVFVDGYYAGVVDDFDGLFQRLPLPPGAHDFVLYLPGYRTVHQTVYLTPDSTYKLRYNMERLPAGETSEPPPAAPPVPPPPAGSYIPPRTQRGGPPMPPPGPPGAPGPPPRAGEPRPMPPRANDFGTLAIRVQPADAAVTIDGERWDGSDGRLSVEVGAGRHHIEIQKSGYRHYATDVVVTPGATTPLNVSLSPEGPQ